VTAPIIPFHGRRHQRHETEAGKYSRPLSMRAAAIRAAAKGEKRMMNQASERGIVAENLGRILTRLENWQGIRKVGVLRMANLGNPDADSTKRLYNYMLAADLDDESRRKREKKLARKALNYIRLVAAAAKLAPVSEDELIVELFSGTSYELPPAEHPEPVFVLLDKLTSVVRWVVAEAGLETYWSDVAETRGAYDVYERAIISCSRRLLTLGDLSGGGIEHIEDIAPIPEVPLLEYPEPASVKARLFIHDAGKWKEAGEVVATACREVRLGVAPVGSAPKAVFVVYSKVVATDGNGVPVLEAMYSDGSLVGDPETECSPVGSRKSPPNDGQTWLPIVGISGEIEWYTNIFVTEGDQKYPAGLVYDEHAFLLPFPHRAPVPFGEFIDGSEPWWVMLLPVVESTVAAYCGMPVDWYGAVDLPREMGATSWPIGTLGEAIEANFLYATDGRFDDRLLADAKRKVEMLRAFKRASAEKQAAAEAELDRKWDVKGE